MDFSANPVIQNAIKQMSPEDIENVRKFGENLYKNTNYDIDKMLNLPISEDEPLAYIEEGIKSGLLAEDLTQDEVILLTKTYGEKWYERYDFKEHEVPEVGLSLYFKRAVEKKINDINNQR